MSCLRRAAFKPSKEALPSKDAERLRAAVPRRVAREPSPRRLSSANNVVIKDHGAVA